MIKSLKAVSGLIAGFLVVALTLYASFRAHNDSQSTFWTTMLVCITGIAVGWLLGFAASPQNSKEEKQFTTYGKLVAGVISGYLLGRFEPSLEAVFKDGKLLTDQLYSIRLMVFVISTIVSAITMFVYRSYLYTETLARKQNG